MNKSNKKNIISYNLSKTALVITSVNVLPSYAMEKFIITEELSNNQTEHDQNLVCRLFHVHIGYHL